MAHRSAKRIDVSMHCVGPGEIVAGKENEIGMLAIDGLDGEMKPGEVLVAIDMEVAYLAGDGRAMRIAEAPHGEIDSRDIDFIDGLAPHPVKRAEREWRVPLAGLRGQMAVGD